MTLDLDPNPALRVEDLHVLHGALTALTGEAHVPRRPAWTILPWPTGCGWAVYWWRQPERWAGWTGPMRIGTTACEARFGPLVRSCAPRLGKRRGHRLVRIDALTPVCCRSDGGTVTYTAPDARTIISSLVQVLAPRLGVEVAENDLRLRLAERATEPRSLFVGGKYGTVRGWVGYIVVDANATAHWMLECAGRGPGLGGRTAFGFGRVVVRAES